MEKEKVVAEQIHIRIHPELRNLLIKEADENYPATLNDIVHKALARHVKRPDLVPAPKKRMGRPPKTASVNGHTAEVA